MAKRRRDDGPSLDDKAREEILREDARHRHRLVEIESGNPNNIADLMAEENDRHLARLTRIYAELADRQMESTRGRRAARDTTRPAPDEAACPEAEGREQRPAR